VRAQVSESGPRRAAALPDAIIGHRGARAVLPENTLAGFRYAVEHGVSAVECDVRLTRDGELVCIHDPSPARAGGPDRLIADMTLAEVGDLTLRHSGGVPGLEAALDVLEPACAVVIEIKNDPGEPDLRTDRATAVKVAETIERRRAQGHSDVVRNVSSFDPMSLDAFVAHSPSCGHVAALLTPAGRSLRAALRQAGAHRLTHVHPHHTSLIGRWSTIRAAAADGIAVTTWTVNSAAMAGMLLRHGAAGVITDDPVRLAADLR
jgi:glycerophosphoryl diester phosphodiesterase